MEIYLGDFNMGSSPTISMTHNLSSDVIKGCVKVEKVAKNTEPIPFS